MERATLDQATQVERPRLLGIAYRMTGSHSDAEDIVQEALLRAHRAPPTEIDCPAAYLTTITTRLAIDHLRSARVRRESYIGPWLPEPIAVDLSDSGLLRALPSPKPVTFCLAPEVTMFGLIERSPSPPE